MAARSWAFLPAAWASLAAAGRSGPIAVSEPAGEPGRLVHALQEIIEAQRGLDAARAGESAVAGPGCAPP